MVKNTLLKVIEIDELIVNESIRYKQKKCISKLIETNREDDLYLFSVMFWENTNNTTKLKKDIGLPTNVKYIDILKAFPTERYTEFTNDFLANGFTEDNLIKKYSLTASQVEKLMIDSDVKLTNRYCSRCFEQEFHITVRNGDFIIHCNSCTAKHEVYEELLQSEQKEYLEGILKDKYKKYQCKYDDIVRRLDQIKCPKCHGRLKTGKLLDWDRFKILRYTKDDVITCTYCNYKAKELSIAEEDYKAFTQRAAMMIKIKEQERAKLSEKLQCKNFDSLRYDIEDIISSDLANEHASEFENICYNLSNSTNMLLELKNRIGYCSRQERNLLLHIIELEGIYKENLIIDEVKYIRFLFDEPLVSTLIGHTGVIIVRKLLKRLMNQFLLLADEEGNYLVLPDYIIQCHDIISSYNELQDVNSELKYMVMKRQNFHCYACREDGKMLKLAYITTNKATMDLNEMLALCADCHHDYTKNDVMTEIVIDTDVIANEFCVSIQFLINYHPDLQKNDYIIKSIVELEKKYGDIETIKALAIGMHRIEKKKIDTLDHFIAYVTAILKNSEQDSVKLYDQIYKKYNLGQWRVKEDCIK